MPKGSLSLPSDLIDVVLLVIADVLASNSAAMDNSLTTMFSSLMKEHARTSDPSSPDASHRRHNCSHRESDGTTDRKPVGCLEPTSLCGPGPA